MAQDPRDEEKKNNPTQGIDPEPEEKQEMEVEDQKPGGKQKNNPDKKKDDSQAA